MKVAVNEGVCTGHGRCYALAPDVFSPDDEGHCVILLDDVPPELESAARAGADNCPEGAISISE